MLSIAGKRTSACDGVSRRELMRVGALSLLPGVSLPRLLQAASSQKTPRQGRAKSVILINLFGGPSHEWHCHVCNMPASSELCDLQPGSQDGSWFLHQLVAVASAFENSRFQATGAIGDFAFGDLGKHLAAIAFHAIRSNQVA